jgi:hypothetical protein
MTKVGHMYDCRTGDACCSWEFFKTSKFVVLMFQDEAANQEKMKNAIANDVNILSSALK